MISRKLQVLLLSGVMVFETGCGAIYNLIPGRGMNDGYPAINQDQTEGAFAYDASIVSAFTEGGYYYELLTDTGKFAYVNIYNALCAVGKANFVTDSKETIETAFKSVMYDHPEIYYVQGYSIESMRSGSDLSVTFDPMYTRTIELIEQSKGEIDAYRSDVALSIGDATTDFDKAKAIYDYIVLNTSYSIEAVETDNIYSVIHNGISVCEGYSKAYQLLMHDAGIECTVVTGNVRATGVAHMWNAAKLDGEWYFFDPTWGDINFENDEQAPEVRYDYFAATTSQIVGTHIIDTDFKLPDCHSVQDNYFIHENMYVTDQTSEDQIAELLSPLAEGRVVSFMCSTESVYLKLKDRLVSQGLIALYSGGSQHNVGYAANDSLFTLSFWLQHKK